jgi:hypothetical protein
MVRGQTKKSTSIPGQWSQVISGPLILKLLSLWETLWTFRKIGSNEKRRNWRFWIHGIYPETAVFGINLAIILIRLRAKERNGGLHSLRFKRGRPGVFSHRGGTGGVMFFDLC